MKQKLLSALSVICLAVCIMLRYLVCMLFSLSFLDAFYMCGITLMIAYFFMKNEKELALKTGAIIYSVYNFIDLLSRRNISAALICMGSLCMLYLLVGYIRSNDKTLIRRLFFIPGLLIGAGMLMMVYHQMNSLSTLESLIFFEPAGIFFLMTSLI